MSAKNRTCNTLCHPAPAVDPLPLGSNSAGTLDQSFGEYRDGLVIYSEAGPGFVGTATRRQDGSLRFVGIHHDTPHCITQVLYDADGYFERDILTPLGTTPRGFIKRVPSGDDGVLMLGNYKHDQQAFCLCLDANGELVTSFGDNGQVRLLFRAPATGYGRGLAVQPADGCILITLKNDTPPGADRDVIVRLDRNGHLDMSFGVAGVVSAEQPGTTFEAIVVQADGRVVVAGKRNGKAMLARYTQWGGLDASFADAGYLELNLVGGGQASCFALAIQDDQQIVAVGTADLQMGVALITRITEHGELDPGFNGGVVKQYPCMGVSFALALQEDGKIVSSGHSHQGSYTRVMRHLENGRLDPDFGIDGITPPINLGDDTSELAQVEVQPDGKILISGRYVWHSAMFRYLGK